MDALTAEIAQLRQNVADLTAEKAQFQNELTQLTTTLLTGLDLVQDVLGNAFSDPNFLIPGATPPAQYQNQNLIAAIANLSKGRLEGLYVNLGGKPGAGPK